MTAPCLLRAWSSCKAELRGWLRHRLGNAIDAEGSGASPDRFGDDEGTRR